MLASLVRSASRPRTSDSRNRRWPPGVRIEPIRPAEAQRVWQVRGILNALDSGQKIELLIQKLKETRSNAEFLREIQRVRG